MTGVEGEAVCIGGATGSPTAGADAGERAGGDGDGGGGEGAGGEGAGGDGEGGGGEGVGGIGNGEADGGGVLGDGEMKHTGSTKVPTLTAPPSSVDPVSGSKEVCEVDLLCHPKRTVPQRSDAWTNVPPGWDHSLKSQIGTGLHCAPALPL